MRSGEDEDVGNALDCVPLAKWDPQGGMELVSEEAALDDFLEVEDLEPLVWVMRKIKGFGKFVGLHHNTSSKKGMRELRNLVSFVNYEGQSG